jgi:peptidoglycan/xylan/chitin deacetylase (PgdA/CDA1 family)
VKNLYMLVGSDEEFDSHWRSELVPRFQSLQDDEWMTFTFGRSDFEVGAGRPDWRRVTSIAFQVYATPGNPAEVEFDRLDRAASNAPPVVSIAFDDGYGSDRNPASPILSRLGLTASSYVIPDRHGFEGFLAQEDIDYLADVGWEIGGHDRFVLTQLSHAQVRERIDLAADFLRERPYRGRSVYAYPLGRHNRFVRDRTAERFRAARGTTPAGQTLAMFTRFNLNAKLAGTGTSLREIVEWIDDAIDYREWLIIVFHRVGPLTGDAEDVTLRLFEGVNRYLAEQEVRAIPVARALALVERLNPSR